MKPVLEWIQAVALGIGGGGLFLVALLDSSILSLPEVADLLLIAAVIEHPGRLVYYAAMATAGSIAGCSLLYWLAGKGGDALLRRRVRGHRVDRGLALFRRFGLLAIVVPAVLPPPAPFKIFVLLAGVAGVPYWRFAAAILVGRGTRYFGEGLLAVWYGQRAVDFLESNGRVIALGLVAIILVAALASWLWRARGRRARQQV